MSLTPATTKARRYLQMPAKQSKSVSELAEPQNIVGLQTIKSTIYRTSRERKQTRGGGERNPRRVSWGRL